MMELSRDALQTLWEDGELILGFPYDDFNLYPYGFPAPTL